MFPLQLFLIDLRFEGAVLRGPPAQIGGWPKSWSECRIGTSSNEEHEAADSK
jgi:hypothetical protein